MATSRGGIWSRGLRGQKTYGGEPGGKRGDMADIYYPGAIDMGGQRPCHLSDGELGGGCYLQRYCTAAQGPVFRGIVYLDPSGPESFQPPCNEAVFRIVHWFPTCFPPMQRQAGRQNTTVLVCCAELCCAVPCHSMLASPPFPQTCPTILGLGQPRAARLDWVPSSTGSAVGRGAQWQ